MMSRPLSALCVAAVSAWSALSFAAAPRGELPIPPGADIPARCQAAETDVRARLAALAAIPEGRLSAKALLDGWNRMVLASYDTGGPLYLAAEVHPDAAVRRAAEACTLTLSALDNAIFQNPALYRVMQAAQPADQVERQSLGRILEDFRDRGVGLPADRQARAKAIFERLDALSQTFARGIREDATKLAFTVDELAGVPADYLARAARDEAGKVLVGLDSPDRDAVLVLATREDVRKRFYLAFYRRGGEGNLKVLDEAVVLRRELAGLFDLPSFAAWRLRSRMAGTPEAVTRFLSDMAAATGPAEQRDIARLRDAKRAFTGDAKAELARWDVDFFDNRLKHERYAVDPETVRAQFPAQPTIDWLLDVSSRLYGLRFAPNTALPVWHQDVRGFGVFDAHDDRYLASFYLDLYPRDGKFNHAAAFPVRPVSTAAGRTPVSVMVANFSRAGFNQDEVETLFHEFGHVLHGVLSQTRYAMEAGTAVRRDFVESPSMMFQEWPWRPEVARRFSAVCPTCKPIDAQLVARLREAARFGKGIWFARQQFYSQYDMALAGEQPQPALDTWFAMERRTALGTVDGTLHPASFGHLLGGYEAGYYGYMWSMALGLDMLSAFGDNAMDPKVGARYRATVLARGGEVPPEQLVAQFLGRKPDSRAFFAEIRGARTARR